MLFSSCKQSTYYNYNCTIDITFSNGIEKQIHYKCTYYDTPRFYLKHKKGIAYLRVNLGQSVYDIASEVICFDIINIKRTNIVPNETKLIII